MYNLYLLKISTISKFITNTSCNDIIYLFDIGFVYLNLKFKVNNNKINNSIIYNK